MSKGELKTVKLSEIRENPVALRAVARDSEQFQQLVDSVRKNGIINPIALQPKDTDKEGNKDGKLYQIIDGLHRYTAGLEAGLPEIPAQILDQTDADVAYTQIIGNIHRKETAPGEYTRGLMRLMSLDPSMTLVQLASLLSVSPAFIQQRLSLVKLNEDIMKLVDGGQIPLSNAFSLAGLPSEAQGEWVQRAVAMGPGEFGPMALAESRRLKAEKRKGNVATPDTEFHAVPVYRKFSEAKAEYEKPQVGPALVANHGLKTAEEGFAMAIKWIVGMDPHSIEAAKQADDERKKKAAEEKAQREVERAQKRAEDARKKQEELNAQAKAAEKAAKDKGLVTA